MRRRPPVSTRPDTLLPYTTRFRSPGYTAQALEQGVVAGNECGRLLIAGKLHPTPTAVAKGRRKGIKRAAAPAKHHEIALHLASRRGLETHNRIGCWP